MFCINLTPLIICGKNTLTTVNIIRRWLGLNFLFFSDGFNISCVSPLVNYHPTLSGTHQYTGSPVQDDIVKTTWNSWNLTIPRLESVLCLEHILFPAYSMIRKREKKVSSCREPYIKEKNSMNSVRSSLYKLYINKWDLVLSEVSPVLENF